MAILKCKMCGGELDVTQGSSICICEYCGTKQTVPNVNDEKKVKRFEKANYLRTNCEFDKAYGVFESIVDDFPREAEAYWGLLLCKYGIEYVDDPKTGKKVPTCHRSSFDSVLEDKNYKLTLDNADAVAKSQYIKEAEELENIRKGIIEISSKEAAYDIFICYKETTDNGERTHDSVLAQDIYNNLVQKGYKVFFARITLENQLGKKYEPYIFSALHSSKLMLVVTTKQEHVNAIWVKNEWSRYLKLIEQGENKTIIPCYKGMSPYDLPDEFSDLQGQDMGKIGAMQDLVHGIEKIIPKQAPKSSSSSMLSANDALLRRMEMFLSDKDFDKAKEYCERILDVDPENARAYLGEFCAEFKISGIRDILNLNVEYVPKEVARLLSQGKALEAIGEYRIETGCTLAEAKVAIERLKNEKPYETADVLKAMKQSKNLDKILKYGEESIVNEILKNIRDVEDKIAESKNRSIYDLALSQMNHASTVDDFESAAKKFDSISGYKNAKQLADSCYNKIQDSIYLEAEALLKAKDYDAAAQTFKRIIGYKNAQSMVDECLERKNKNAYDQAVEKMRSAYSESDFLSAAKRFAYLGNYRDSKVLEKDCNDRANEIRSYDSYQKGIELYNQGKSASSPTTAKKKLEEAILCFKEAKLNKEAYSYIQKCNEEISQKKVEAEINNICRKANYDSIAQLTIAVESLRKIDKKYEGLYLPKITSFNTRIETLKREERNRKQQLEDELKRKQEERERQAREQREAEERRKAIRIQNMKLEKRAGVAQAFLFVLMGFITLCTVLGRIVAFWDDCSPFWAIVWGIIVGLGYSLVRVVASTGLGVLWWPDIFRGMVPFVDAETSSLVTHIVCYAFMLWVIIVISQRHKYNKRTGLYLTRFVDGIIPFVDGLIYIAFAISVVFSGIKDLFLSWDVWWIFEIPCGLVYGLFRAIMLLIGAGYWWPSLYAGTGLSGLVLNTCVIIFVIVDIILRKKGVLED